MADKNRMKKSPTINSPPKIENEIAEDREPAKGEVYGIAAVSKALRGVDFPCPKDQLLEKVDSQKQIAWTKETTINFREVIENLPQDRFDTIADLTQSMNEAIYGSMKS